MQNPWLVIDDENDFNDGECDYNGSYCGVFNRPPNEIAKTLERPHAPLPKMNNLILNKNNENVYQSGQFIGLRTSKGSKGIFYSNPLIYAY